MKNITCERTNKKPVMPNLGTYVDGKIKFSDHTGQYELNVRSVVGGVPYDMAELIIKAFQAGYEFGWEDGCDNAEMTFEENI